MNVLIVHAGKGFYGGAEEVIVQLCKYLRDNGHGVRLIATDTPFWEGESWAVICNNYRKLWVLVRKNLGTGWVDIINVHNFPSTLAPFPTRKPIVWMCNEPPELFTNWWRKPIEAFNRWWTRKSGMKVVVADRMQARRFKSIYKVEPAVIPYGIDYNFWSLGERRGTKRVFTLLQVGNITPYKNQETSVKVLEELKEFLHAKLVFLANSIDFDYLRALQSNIKWNDTTIIIQKGLSHEKVKEWYYRADVLLHPVEEQGGWLVPFEAMCARLPVIVSPKFTGADIIKDNQLGCVTDNYALSIKQLLLNPEPNLITEHAKEWVRDNLTWEKYGEGMLKVFEDALK